MKIPCCRGLILAGLLILPLAGLRGQSYEEILADPATWPKEIEVTAITKGRVLQGDKIAGMALVGAGRRLTVLQLRPDGIVVRYGSANVLLPPDKTNVLTAAGAAEAVAEPVESPAPPAAAAEPANPGGPAGAVQRELVGRLVRLENGALKPYDMRQLNGVKFYGIMFSAGWCGPCREFAPHLLESYRSLRRIYPEFELVLVSNDRSAADMLAYMRDEKMPWPAVKFSEIEGTELLTKLGGPGIPCLVLIDADGRVLAHSFKGSDYVGPDSVLDATWRVLKQNRRG